VKCEAFSDDAPGVLSPTVYGDEAGLAFSPHPLPPDINWDGSLAMAVSDADRALGELSGLGRTAINPQLLIRPFIRREAVLSSRIEGTQADVGQVYAYEAGQLSFLSPEYQPSQIADVQEVANYVRAMEYGLERMETLPVCLPFMQELHERLMAGARGAQRAPGQFRRVQVIIGPSNRLSDATFVPAALPQMQPALNELEKYLHSDDPNPPLVRLALIHYQFEAIHPFLDGNGRIGRLLIPLLMVNWGLLPSPLLYLSAYFEQHRPEYYDHLLAVSQRGAWREWIVFFLRGVTEQAQDAISRAKRLQDLQLRWRHALIQTRTSAFQLQLLDSLFQTPVLTIPQAQTLLNTTYKSAKLNVEKLTEIGILQQVDESTYAKSFAAMDILRIMEQP